MSRPPPPSTSKQVLKQNLPSLLSSFKRLSSVWNGLTSLSCNFLRKYTTEALLVDQDTAAGGSWIFAEFLWVCVQVWLPLRFQRGSCRVILECLCAFPAETLDKQFPVFSSQNRSNSWSGNHLVILYSWLLLQGHSSAGFCCNLMRLQGRKDLRGSVNGKWRITQPFCS